MLQGRSRKVLAVLGACPPGRGFAAGWPVTRPQPCSSALLLLSSQIIGPLEDNELFNQDDFHLLENIILKTSGQKIKSHIQQLRVEEDV